MTANPHMDTTNVWQVMGETFELSSKFKVTDYLGAGAYGVVCAALDTENNTTVAIKKCKKIFHSRTLAKRTLREIRLLRLFNHENIIKIRSILRPFDLSSFDSLYLVFELMETDLAQIIRSPQRLRDQHIQYFTFQLLLSLKYLHDADIVHRDLKPRNLLVNGDCLLKLADFGLARLYNKTNDTKIIAMTEYVTTRWYRAPEVLVGWTTYSSAIDMWAVGCIIGELIGRTPLFPGADSAKQLTLICQFLGKPSNIFIENSRKHNYRQYLRDLDQSSPIDLNVMFPDANPLAVDLMARLLKFSPDERLTAEEALSHPYMKAMPKYFQRQVCKLSYPTKEFDFENRKLSWENLRSEIIREVVLHNPTNESNTLSEMINYPSAVDLRIAAVKSSFDSEIKERQQRTELKAKDSSDNFLSVNRNNDDLTVDNLKNSISRDYSLSEKMANEEITPSKFKDEYDNSTVLDSKAMAKSSHMYRPSSAVIDKAKVTLPLEAQTIDSKEVSEPEEQVTSKRSIRKGNVYDCVEPEDAQSSHRNCIIM